MYIMSVVLWLFSGLGDQLFMIFTACALALENNVDYSIISHRFKTIDNNEAYWDNIFSACSSKLKDVKMYENPSYIEESSDFKKISYEPGEENVIKGYFQSYKYFDQYSDEICNIFGINVKQMALKIKNSHLFNKKLVAIHIVADEYIAIQNEYCIKKPQYYIRAILSLINDIGKDNINQYDFMVFYKNEDELHVSKYMKILKTIIKIPINFVEVSHDMCDWEQLLLMSCCEHFIMANTSISWFAAYLSQNQDKIVYYPQNWFSNISSRHSADMFPPNWKAICD